MTDAAVRLSGDPLAGSLTDGPVRASARGDRIFQIMITAFAISIPLLLVVIAVSIGLAAWPALSRSGLSFLTGSRWDVGAGEFGAAPAIYGTLVSSALALVIATPLALGVSIFLSEIAPKWLRQPIGFLVDLLAAIPSVVYGLWG
ncbi:MAG: phosphate ABC transporter permease PstC, partial [Gemmatimonadales bacterium]